MIALALRGLAARRLRSALTAVAVVLGVAMVAGTFVLTDQIRNAFDAIQSQAVEGLDVVVGPKEAFQAGFTEPATLRESLVSRVERVPGVAAAHGFVTTSGQVIVDGKALDTEGAPSLVVGYAPEPFNPTRLLEGREPLRRGEAAVLQQTAERAGLGVGDELRLATDRGVRRLRVSGIIAFGSGGSSLGGATLVVAPQRQVQRWFGMRGRVSGVDVVADAGVAPGQLAEAIRAALPRGLKVQTAAESARESADEINSQIGGFLTPALLAFSGAALLVGAFIIFNTFSITVAQRTRELAMLRALGATRAQLVAEVCGEALLLGLAASAIGIVAGLGFARLLNAIFNAIGFGIPVGAPALAARTVAVTAAVGSGVTLLAALAPALRASRIEPAAAMREALPASSRRSRRLSTVAAALMLLGGAALIVNGLFGAGAATGRLASIGGGAVLVFVGVALVSRYAVGTLAWAIGAPIQRALGATGRLARENAARNPGRTAITSAALMVGLGLVVFVAVFAASLKSTFARQIDALVRAQIFVSSPSFQPIPARTAHLVGRVSGVRSVVSLRYDQVEVNGHSSSVTYDLLGGIDPRALRDAYTFQWVQGDDSLLSRLGRDDALIEEQFAKAHGLSVGDGFRVLTPSGGRGVLTAVGIYRDPTILQGLIVTPATFGSLSAVRNPFGLLVSLEPGASAAAVQARIERVLRPYPNATVQNRSQYKERISDQLDRIVYLVYALLAMSVIVSLFGIANSLFLSVHERTRELGLLKAVGATAGQLRRMIRYESVIIAAIGALLGTLLGVVFGTLTVTSLSEFGLRLSVPPLQLAAFALVAALVGVIGAIGPARRGARMDVLAAIRHE